MDYMGILCSLVLSRWVSGSWREALLHLILLIPAFPAVFCFCVCKHAVPSSWDISIHFLLVTWPWSYIHPSHLGLSTTSSAQPSLVPFSWWDCLVLGSAPKYRSYLCPPLYQCSSLLWSRSPTELRALFLLSSPLPFWCLCHLAPNGHTTNWSCKKCYWLVYSWLLFLETFKTQFLVAMNNGGYFLTPKTKLERGVVQLIREGVGCSLILSLWHVISSLMRYLVLYSLIAGLPWWLKQ